MLLHLLITIAIIVQMTNRIADPPRTKVYFNQSSFLSLFKFLSVIVTIVECIVARIEVGAVEDAYEIEDSQL